MREWESDPLFAAAEVVQDSADRMESIFRLLLHEQSLVEGDHIDEKLMSSSEYHRRDLATTLETAKWQLEDFEREVNASAIADKSQRKQNVITRHRQFIAVIREQIAHVEKSMSTSVGSLRNMNLNDQDRDGLALFLLGGKPIKHIAVQETEDNNILRRFLDPGMSSSSKEDVDEKKAGETMSMKVNEIVCLEHNLELTENFPTTMDMGPSSSGHANYDRYEEGAWDLEANEPQSKSYLQKNKLKGYYGRINIFGSLGNIMSTLENRASRSFTKRLKDGEEQRQSPLYSNVRPGILRYIDQLRPAFGCSNFHLPYSYLSAQAMQSSNWIRCYSEKCQRYLHRIQVRYHPALSILALFMTLLILSKYVGVLRKSSCMRFRQHIRVIIFPVKSMATNGNMKSNRRTAAPTSAFETRVSLVFALAAQTSSLSQRFLTELATETTKYVFPNRRFESRSLEEALMSVPDIETVEFKVLRRNEQYEIREVESYFIAETTMPGKNGFDFAGASRSFNVLAEYLFGKNTREKQMEMTTPVFTRRIKSDGEKMDMTTPVITRKVEDQDKWKMSFVMPSKYGSDLPLPKDSSVTIKEVPKRIVAVVAFSGFVTDEEVERRESTLRDLLNNDPEFRVKEGISVEVAQYNPPFTLPFNRRNEIALEVERKREE